MQIRKGRDPSIDPYSAPHFTKSKFVFEPFKVLTNSSTYF